ncbi:MAG: hypothetical protein CMJ83_01380 [Planctomycetes bacterium]|nr:hypothetical protein [Planctomycetota bacterium]
MKLMILTVAVTFVCAACGGDDSGSNDGSFVDASVTRLDALGWMGARVQPLGRLLTATDGDETRDPGGVVLRELPADGPLAKAGAKVGDVVVRIGEEWVPLKKNPVLDVIRLVELAVSSGEETVTVGCWRAGAMHKLSLSSPGPAIEVGLPVSVERFVESARRGVTALVSMQRDDGGFPSAKPADELAVAALAALALRAAGAATKAGAPEAKAALRKVEFRIDALLANEDQKTPLSFAFAVMERAERIGPLPNAVQLAGPKSKGGSSGGSSSLPMGGPSGGSHVITLEGALPADLAKMIESIGGKGAKITFGPAGAPGARPGPGGSKPGKISGKPADSGQALAALLQLLDGDRLPKLEGLEPIVAALLAHQQDDGGFGPTDAPAADRIALTSQALLALGAANRVGGEASVDPAGKAIGFLSARLHGGKLPAAVAKGADRRCEAGRSAQAALALRAVGCGDDDDLLKSLVGFSDRMGREVCAAPTSRPYHVLATALLRRGRGLRAWQTFYDDFRFLLLAGQHPDGTFQPMQSPDPTPLEGTLTGPASATALGVLLVSLQSERVPTLTGHARNPFAPTLDGKGKPSSGKATTSTPMTDSKQAADLLKKLGAPAPTKKNR